MLSNTILLKNQQATEKQFVLVGQGPSDSRRVRSDSTPGLPNTLVIKHSVQGAKADAIDRHLIQFTSSKEDAKGVARTAIVNTTISVPRSGFTQADVTELLTFLVKFLTTPSASLGTTSSSTVVSQDTTTASLLLGEV